MKFKFLEDKPLESLSNLGESKFGHEEVAKTLSKIVLDCPPTFTIGLFGRWGSGKSTIANYLKEDLQTTNIPVVIFDVWKHEGDALRRTFLKEVVNQLKSEPYGKEFFNQEFFLDDRIENDVTRKSEGKFKINLEKLKQFRNLGIALVVGIFAAGIAFYYLNIFIIFQIFLTLLGGVISTLIGGSVVVWLIQNVGQFFTTETTTFGRDRFKDPHEFEQEFSRILQNLKTKKIVIVFDNLDRVTHENAVKVLSTIKTFLEPSNLKNLDKDVIFLIPCDSAAIRQHITKAFEITTAQSALETDEFLRKFFNSILWIPEFIPSELEAYAREKLRETTVPELDNDKVAWVITKAFRENPRQIIQFINILLANYLLIKLREGDKKDFPEHFLKENIPQLAKYLILTELFPKETEELRKQKVLNLQDVNKENFKNNIDFRIEEFIDFIKETESDIPIDNLRLFFTFRRSEYEKRFPGIETFIAFLDDRKDKDADKFIDQITDIEKKSVISSLSHVIKSELENKTNPISTASFISTLLSVLSNRNITLEDTVYGEIYNKLSGPIKNQLHTISPTALNAQLLKPYSQYREGIIESWANILNDQNDENNTNKVSEKYINDLLQIFSEHPEYLKVSSIEDKLKETFKSPNYSHNLIFTSEITKYADLQKRLISNKFISEFCKNIAYKSEDAAETDIINYLNIINNIDISVFSKTNIDEIIIKFNELIIEENKNDIKTIELKTSITRELTEFFSTRQELIQKAEEKNINTLTQSVIASANAIDVNNRKIFITLLLVLNDNVTEAVSTQIIGLVNTFFESADIPSVDNILNIVTSKKIVENPIFSQVFEKRALANQHFFDYVYKLEISSDTKNSLLEKLLKADKDRAIHKIADLSFKIPNAVNISKITLNLLDSSQASEKTKLVNLANNLRCGNDAQLRDELTEKLEIMLKSTDVVLQQIGHNGLAEGVKHLGEGRLRRITKNVFDWLRTPVVADKYQPFSIRSIFFGYEAFNEEEKKEFQQFIFEELIRKGTSVESVNLGFELLTAIKPKYEDRPQNFNDLKDRLNTEQNSSLKASLLEGIKSLKPERTNKTNKEYWEEIENLIL